IAKPDEPVIALVGDGAWSMCMQEVMTSVRERINLVSVVLNNSVYGAERRNQTDFFSERYFWTDLENPDFAAIAHDMGALGVRVEEASQIGPALSDALKTDRPLVIDIILDSKELSEPYRRDAMRTPNRVLPKYS